MIDYLLFFCLKQKTAYEMRISDWSSDVCSSDLLAAFQQRQVGVDLAEEEPGAGIAAHQQGVLADPAECGIAGMGFFQRRRTVGEYAVAVRPALFFDALRELAQPRAHQLVVIATQGVPRNVRVVRQIGRASWRESGVRDGENGVVAGSL